MDKKKAIESLKQALSEIPDLIKKPYNNQDFNLWRRKIGEIIIAGLDKDDYNKFTSAFPSMTLIRGQFPDNRYQQEYDENITRHEIAIKSIIQKYEIVEPAVVVNTPPKVSVPYSKDRGTKMERDYYKIIKEKLELLLTTKFSDFHLEITADKHFSNKLKAQVSQNRDIIFSFMREAAPDITGFIKEENSTNFLVVEVKRETIKLDDIYQARKYAELFDARFGLLISTKEIPEEIKRLHRVVYSLLSLPAYKTLTIVHYHDDSKEFIEWFPKNPFEKE
jgi:hypothetical protein